MKEKFSLGGASAPRNRPGHSPNESKAPPLRRSQSRRVSDEDIPALYSQRSRIPQGKVWLFEFARHVAASGKNARKMKLRITSGLCRARFVLAFVPLTLAASPTIQLVTAFSGRKPSWSVDAGGDKRRRLRFSRAQVSSAKQRSRPFEIRAGARHGKHRRCIRSPSARRGNPLTPPTSRGRSRYHLTSAHR